MTASVSNSITVRLELPGRATAISELTGAIERTGGLITGLDITSSDTDRLKIDVTVAPRDGDHAEEIVEAMRGVEWVLHAADQDLPCLRDDGFECDELFDTELAGRLLGAPRVNLAAMTSEYTGYALAKGHGAADWSTRPLPHDWLNYAALDVEVLVDLRDEAYERLSDAGKLEWALEEFEAVRTAPPAAPRKDPWRRTSGITKIRGRRQLTALRNLWTEREELARHKDISPGRLLPDSALVAVAQAMPRSVPQLLRTPGFHGRAASKEAPRWLRALSEARQAEELVPQSVSSDSLPPVKSWTVKRPAAAERLRGVFRCPVGDHHEHRRPGHPGHQLPKDLQRGAIGAVCVVEHEDRPRCVGVRTAGFHHPPGDVERIVQSLVRRQIATKLRLLQYLSPRPGCRGAVDLGAVSNRPGPAGGAQTCDE